MPAPANGTDASRNTGAPVGTPTGPKAIRRVHFRDAPQMIGLAKNSIDHTQGFAIEIEEKGRGVEVLDIKRGIEYFVPWANIKNLEYL